MKSLKVGSHHPDRFKDKTVRRSRVWKIQTKKLLNPVRFLAQKYVDNITRESTLAPEKRRLLHTHLYQFTKKIPWYMKDNKPIVENTKDDVKLQTSMKKTKSLNKKLLTQLLNLGN